MALTLAGLNPVKSHILYPRLALPKHHSVPDLS